MSTNKDLLKQAIAEAKTVREAAIANAKEALEESLTPHLKEMLAQKLQEMENEEMDEEVLDETLNGAEAESFSENPKRHGNVLREEEDEEAPEEDEEEPTEDEEGEEEDLNIEDMSVEDLKDLIRDIVAQETGHDEEAEMNQTDDLGADDMTGMEDGEEEIDINELLAELEMDEYGDEHPVSRADALKDKEVDEGHSYKLKPGAESGDTAGPNDGFTKAAPKSKNPGSEKQFVKFVKEEEGDLEEALNTVAELRKQLQEVNLLNAKLLYVNKVFKANNLSEGQKVNVVAAFDKAETVKEVKLVFETVSKNVVAKQTAKPAIKEHKSFASKPAGSTQKQVINEVSEAVNRMQVLAGIKPREY